MGLGLAGSWTDFVRDLPTKTLDEALEFLVFVGRVVELILQILVVLFKSKIGFGQVCYLRLELLIISLRLRLRTWGSSRLSPLQLFGSIRRGMVARLWGLLLLLHRAFVARGGFNSALVACFDSLGGGLQGTLQLHLLLN